MDLGHLIIGMVGLVFLVCCAALDCPNRRLKANVEFWRNANDETHKQFQSMRNDRNKALNELSEPKSKLTVIVEPPPEDHPVTFERDIV